MIKNQPDAFAAFNNNAAAAIDAIVGPRMEAVIKSIDDFINGLIHRAGDICGAGLSKLGEKCANMGTAATQMVKSAGENFSAFSEKSSPAQDIQIARSLQVEVESPSVPIPEKVRGMAAVAMQNSQVVAATHIPDGTHVSPMAVGYAAQSTGYSVSV